jgi:hypothetical protein
MSLLLINKLTYVHETDFVIKKSHVAIPQNCRPIKEVVAKWEQDEQRRQMLAEARQWLVDTFIRIFREKPRPLGRGGGQMNSEALDDYS